MRSRFAAISFSLFLGACGGGESAVEKCDDLVDTLCEKGVECVGGSKAECVQAAASQLACGRAVKVTASYDRCLDEIDEFSCSTLFPTDPETGQPTLSLPADCMGVILLD
jgi:hypothetical protein